MNTINNNPIFFQAKMQGAMIRHNILPYLAKALDMYQTQNELKFLFGALLQLSATGNCFF